MANVNLMVAEEYPTIALVVERMFTRMFPTLELDDFNALRTDREKGRAPCTQNHHWIRFVGTESELLRLGLIDKSMVAIRPKRVVYFEGGHTKRLAGDRLSVYLSLYESLDRAHPLAAFAPWNWPIADGQRPARVPYLRLVVDNTRAL